MEIRLIRLRIHKLLEAGKGTDLSSKFVDYTLIALVLLSILSVILGSVPEIHDNYTNELRAFEVFTIIVFSLEYLLRIWTAPLKYSQNRFPKVKYALSFYGLIDLIAIIPFYISYFGFGLDLRVLRVVRMMRILKISHYNSALQDLFNAIYDERKTFISAIYIFLVALLISSSLIYYAENSSQPDDFRSIPDALWWSIITLTTVGYGDVSPVSLIGKIIGAITAIMGVCTVALLTGIVANAFSAQLSRKKSIFRVEVFNALRDGVITDEEKEHLKALRDEFNLTQQHAESIFNEVVSEFQNNKDKSQRH